MGAPNLTTAQIHQSQVESEKKLRSPSGSSAQKTKPLPSSSSWTCGECSNQNNPLDSNECQVCMIPNENAPQ